MGKTYEALKRAEAERKAKAAREARGVSKDPATSSESSPNASAPDVVAAATPNEPSDVPVESAASSFDSPARAQPGANADLPAPAQRRWFRFGRDEASTGKGQPSQGAHPAGRGRSYGNGNGHAHAGSARTHGGNGRRNENGNGFRGNGYRGGSSYRAFTFDVPPTTTEEFQQLRKNLLATKAPRSLQLMLLVSSRHGEGATTTTALLGLTMSQGGRCLLIDTNFRTPGLTRIFGGDHAPGLCEALTDGGATPDHYHATEIPNLYFMPTGQGPTRVPYMFEGRAFDDVVTSVRREFDSILIDGAPMEMYADSSYLAPRADGVILVVQAETTPIGAPAVSLRELERVGAHVLGAVLNRTQNYIPELIARLTNPQELIEVAIVPGPEGPR